MLARTGDLRPVLAWRDREGVRAFAFGAHPSQTDLVLRAAFPTLVANLVEVFRGSGRAPLGCAPTTAAASPSPASPGSAVAR